MKITQNNTYYRIRGIQRKFTSGPNIIICLSQYEMLS